MPTADTETVASHGSTLCAYCRRKGAMTREHIIPSFLYRAFPKQKLGYNSKADRFMAWEAQIKDVCTRCNNGPLATLDGYARRFLTAIECKRTYQSRERLRIEYDYELLLRWLLKVSFNSARAFSEPDPLLSKTVPFILGEKQRPPTLAFLSIEVVQDTPIHPEERATLPFEARDWTHVPSHMFRVGPGVLHDPSRSRPHTAHCIRFVAINAWYFTLCLIRSTTAPARRRQLSIAYQRMAPDALHLRPYSGAAELKVSRRTGFDLYAFHGLRVRRQWFEYAKEAFTTTAGVGIEGKT